MFKRLNKILFSLLLIIILLSFTGCKKEKEKTVEDLLDDYITAYMTSDLELSKKVFPPYYMSFSSNNMTKENLENSLKNDKEKLGDDFKVTYNITSKTKMTDEELDNLNKKMTNQYSAKEKASICYKLEGTLDFKGSKGQITDRLSTMNYCKYDNTWYLVRIY